MEWIAEIVIKTYNGDYLLHSVDSKLESKLNIPQTWTDRCDFKIRKLIKIGIGGP